LAVSGGAVATPLALVVEVAVAELPNVARAPLLGAVSVTVTPLSRFPPLSFTVACNAVANAVLMVALCGVPAPAVMLAGTPSLFVKLKLADVPTPDTLAVTV
jgi:hypothetical protein